MREDHTFRDIALIVIALMTFFMVLAALDVRDALRSIDNDLQIIAKQEGA